jgi:hypothetical protein
MPKDLPLLHSKWVGHKELPIRVKGAAVDAVRRLSRRAIEHSPDSTQQFNISQNLPLSPLHCSSHSKNLSYLRFSQRHQTTRRHVPEV